eukprot:GHVL01042863.1.p1 GENE.GHVL01042863.1~~GHVL01042863.1.p1  ORF type:complete len:997 (-),score=152.31 GHVL01042863.1:1293-4283(-)
MPDNPRHFVFDKVVNIKPYPRVLSMCWCCGTCFDCTLNSDFGAKVANVEIRQEIVIEQSFYICNASSRLSECRITVRDLLDYREGDRAILTQEECGVGSSINSYINAPNSEIVERIATYTMDRFFPVGLYNICWCNQNDFRPSCPTSIQTKEDITQYRFKLGTFSLLPQPFPDIVCYVHLICVVEPINYYLNDKDDQIIIVRRADCENLSLGYIVVAPVTSENWQFSLKFDDDTPVGTYTACFCEANVASITTSCLTSTFNPDMSRFTHFMGHISISMLAVDDFSCFVDSFCEWGGSVDSNLSNGDVAVISTESCYSLTMASVIVSFSSYGDNKFSFPISLSTPVNSYNLCSCSAYFSQCIMGNAPNLPQFKSKLATVAVMLVPPQMTGVVDGDGKFSQIHKGPQDYDICTTKWESCTVILSQANYWGYNKQDKLMISPFKCGNASSMDIYKIFDITPVIMEESAVYSVISINRQLSVGIYNVCWCSGAHGPSNCLKDVSNEIEANKFLSDIGQLLFLPPKSDTINCKKGEICELTLDDYIPNEGTDRLVVLNTKECLVNSSLLFYVQVPEKTGKFSFTIPQGVRWGTFIACFCTGKDLCEVPTSFYDVAPAYYLVGEIFVGIEQPTYNDEEIICARGSYCSWRAPKDGLYLDVLSEDAAMIIKGECGINIEEYDEISDNIAYSLVNNKIFYFSIPLSMELGKKSICWCSAQNEAPFSPNIRCDISNHKYFIYNIGFCNIINRKTPTLDEITHCSINNMKEHTYTAKNIECIIHINNYNGKVDVNDKAVVVQSDDCGNTGFLSNVAGVQSIQYEDDIASFTFQFDLLRNSEYSAQWAVCWCDASLHACNQTEFTTKIGSIRVIPFDVDVPEICKLGFDCDVTIKDESPPGLTDYMFLFHGELRFCPTPRQALEPLYIMEVPGATEHSRTVAFAVRYDKTQIGEATVCWCSSAQNDCLRTESRNMYWLGYTKLVADVGTIFASCSWLLISILILEII